MGDKNWLVGTLLRQGRLKTESDDVLLTALPPGSPEAPEWGACVVEEADLGKVALVKGQLVGSILHSAEIVEILPLLTGTIIQKLVEKGIVSLQEIQNQLSDLEREKQENLKTRKLCALVIGHKKSSPGAANENTGLSEFDFNEDLAMRIESKVRETDIQRVYRRTYDALPGDINLLNPHFVVSLHCNAYDGNTSGTEVLYYHRSEVGRRIAQVLQRHLLAFLGLRDRGIKGKTTEDRGGPLLRYTNAPCVIAEPFFIDNDHDLAKAREDLDGLAAAYAEAIDKMAGLV